MSGAKFWRNFGSKPQSFVGLSVAVEFLRKDHTETKGSWM